MTSHSVCKNPACGFDKIPPGKARCPSCKSWIWVDDPLNDGDGSVMYEDIASAEIHRISVGIMDDCFCGGIVRSDVALIAGLPGAGKSTLLLQIAESFCKIGECMYIAAEEDLMAIKARGIRLGIATNGRLRFIPAIGGVADIGELLMKHKPRSIILDSLDGLVSHELEAEVKALEIIKKYCVSLQAPAIVISQVNKESDYSGLMAKQHAVDVLLTLMPDEDLRTANEEPVRLLETQKNRNGPAFVRTWLEMTSKGLQVCDVTQLTEEQNKREQEK